MIPKSGNRFSDKIMRKQRVPRHQRGSAMATTRRDVLAGGLATLASSPAIIRAQAQPSAARTVKAVMHADLRVLDPIWTTANISAYHGGMIYDTLFGLGEKFTPQPQMVSPWGVSDAQTTSSSAL